MIDAHVDVVVHCFKMIEEAEVKEMFKSFHCENCNKDYDNALLDGYAFGDRLLEGVMFKCQVDEKGWHVEITPECKTYFEDLNQKKWLKEATEYCEENDIWACPVCRNDVCPEE